MKIHLWEKIIDMDYRGEYNPLGVDSLKIVVTFEGANPPLSVNKTVPLIVGRKNKKNLRWSKYDRRRFFYTSGHKTAPFERCSCTLHLPLQPAGDGIWPLGYSVRGTLGF